MDNQQTPSAAKQTNTAPAAKSSKGPKVLLLGALGFFLLLAVVLIGGTVYASTSNKNVPVFSELVEQVEKVQFNTNKSTRSDSVKELAAPVANMLGQSDTFASDEVSEEDLKDLFGDTEIYSFEYDLDALMKVDASNEGSTPGELIIKSDGAVYSKDKEEKADLNLSASFETQGSTISGNGSIRMIEDKVYLKISEMPPLLGMDFSSITGQWLESEAEDAAEATTSTPSDESLFTEEEMDVINAFLESDSLNENLEKLSDEVVNDVRTNCYQLDINEDDALEILKDVNESLEKDKMTDKEMQDAVKGLKQLLLKWCVGRKDGYLYKLEALLKSESETSGDYTLDLKMKLWNYNTDFDVEVPSNTRPMEEALQELMEESGSTMYDPPIPTRPSNNGVKDTDYDFDDYDFEDYQ